MTESLDLAFFADDHYDPSVAEYDPSGCGELDTTPQQ
jgi:hypothetical protein